MVSKPLFVMSSVDEFFINFNFSIIMLCVILSNILIIASPDISSINGASTLINFCFFDFNNMHFLGQIGRDLFRKLKQQSHEFVTSSS